MKKNNMFWLCLLVVFTLCNRSMAQTTPLGSSKRFLNTLKKNIKNSTSKTTNLSIVLDVTDSKTLEGKINFKVSNVSSEFLMGSIENIPESSFYLKAMSKSLEGHIILKTTKEAYKYYSDTSGNVFVSKVDINSLICIDYRNVPENQTSGTNNKAVATQIAPALLELQSLPGARGCVLLDFDGYYMSAGNYWNDGNAIDAASSGMSDSEIQRHWEVVSEDYRPFNLNVTTNETVFNSYSKNMRMRVVITPTNTAAPGAGGVAYIGSFNWNNDVPCWVFITSGKSGGDASSHEIGHTFDLGHDGRTNPGEEYFLGIDGTSWAPIMGAGYYRPITQWSKGQYDYANNLEDDVAIITGSKFGVGYRGDDYGDNTASATNLDYNSSGTINKKKGVIHREADYDFFSFTTGGGTVSIQANTLENDGDLHLLLRLYNASGTEIGTYWNSDAFALNASMDVLLDAGKYFIGVDGTGAGNTGYGGYSAYGSIGSYSITGSIPPGGNIESSTGLVTAYLDCNYTGFSGGLSIGDYTLSQLQAIGLVNDKISALKITQGFQAILYQDDNFLGSSTVINSDNTCLNTTWNDEVSSIRVIANGDISLGNATYYLQNRNSGLHMDVWDLSLSHGANIAQGTPNDGANQKFTFTHLGNGLYKIIVNHSGQSLDINNFNPANGANVEQYPYNATSNQQFVLFSTGDGYYKMIPKHSGKLVEVSDFSTTNGGNIQQWENKDQASGQWKLIPTTALQSSTLIEAENYSSMRGIQTETTTDTGGGLNVAYADTGDWMAYSSINFPTSGSYLIEYRVASTVETAVISSDLNAGSVVLGSVNIPNTGGWQNWQTISQTVNINADTYDFGIYIVSTGVNINWIRITKVELAAVTVAEIDSNANISTISNIIFPNPVEATLFFSLDMTETQVRIVNSQGALLSLKVNNNSMDVSALESGVYSIIMIDKSGKRTVKRFIKK